MRLAAERPGDLLDNEAGGKLPGQRQEAVLIFFHATSIAPAGKQRNSPLIFAEFPFQLAKTAA